MDSPCDCQLIALYDASSELNAFERARLLALRIPLSLIRRAKRRAASVKRALSGRGGPRSRPAEPPDDRRPGAVLRAGDLVEILPYEDIAKTLNEENLTQGLYFMPAMRKYCGTTQKVLKNVRCMFDEQSWGMIKLRNVVLIEGAVCDGKGMGQKEKCARSCFYFWKEAWLRKI